MKQRYHLLDTIRGVCIILVVWYHVLFNLSEIFGGNYAFFRSAGMSNFRDGFVGVLMVLAGIACVWQASRDYKAKEAEKQQKELEEKQKRQRQFFYDDEDQ